MPATIPFAAGAIDRAGHRRLDAAWLEAAKRSDDVQFLLMRGGQPLVTGDRWTGPSGPGLPTPSLPCDLLWLGSLATSLAPDAGELFLGVDGAGRPVFALDMPDSFDLDRSPLAGFGHFADMRVAAANLPATDTHAAATARSIFDWRRRHGFCANCGTPTQVTDAGWKRVCPSCQAEHFPRVDPVAIMLAVIGDRCLLGRQKTWPPGFFSALAGFVEPGETFEQAARRELFEEAGVHTTDRVEYLFCQPWPFPSSLMIGMIVEAESDQLRIDETEIETARWFTRAEARDILAGRHPEVSPPSPVAVARHILSAWAARD